MFQSQGLCTSWILPPLPYLAQPASSHNVSSRCAREWKSIPAYCDQDAHFLPLPPHCTHIKHTFADMFAAARYEVWKADGSSGLEHLQLVAVHLSGSVCCRAKCCASMWMCAAVRVTVCWWALNHTAYSWGREVTGRLWVLIGPLGTRRGLGAQKTGWQQRATASWHGWFLSVSRSVHPACFCTHWHTLNTHWVIRHTQTIARG